MKSIYLIFVLFFSCNVPNAISGLDTDGFSSSGNVIYYKNEPYAVLQAVTYSLDGKKMVRELNFKLYENSNQSLARNLIWYIYEKNKGCEVEIEVMIDDISKKF